MTPSWQNVDATARGDQHGLTFDLHHDFSGEDVEKLLRFFVIVADFGRARRHEFFDHSEMLVLDHEPCIAIGAPAIVLCVLVAHRAGQIRVCVGRVCVY